MNEGIICKEYLETVEELRVSVSMKLPITMKPKIHQICIATRIECAIHQYRCIQDTVMSDIKVTYASMTC